MNKSAESQARELRELEFDIQRLYGRRDVLLAWLRMGHDAGDAEAQIKAVERAIDELELRQSKLLDPDREDLRAELDAQLERLQKLIAKSSQPPELTPDQFDMMRHATGNGLGYRNYFCAEVGGPDAAEWEKLCALGYARKTYLINDGRDAIYKVTDAGLKLIGVVT